MKKLKILLLSLFIIISVNVVMAVETLPVLPLTACAMTNDDIHAISETYSLTNTGSSELLTFLDSKRKADGELDSVVTKFNSVSTQDRYIFQGTFKSLDDSLVIAVLSDDGVEVTIDNTLVKFNNFDKGQALPNLNNSLKVIEGVWNDRNLHTIRIRYSNICYTGKGDIDGLTVFFCGGVDIIPPTNEEPVPVTVSLSLAKDIYSVNETGNTTATARIVYSGSGNYNKTWEAKLYKDGVLVSGVTTQTASYDPTKSFCEVTFPNIPIDGGNYQVKVDKGGGSFLTADAKLLEIGVTLEFPNGFVYGINSNASAKVTITGNVVAGDLFTATITGTGGPTGTNIPTSTMNLNVVGTTTISIPNQPALYSYNVKVKLIQSINTDSVLSIPVYLTVYKVTDISISGATLVVGTNPEVYTASYDPCLDTNTDDDYIVLTAITDPVVNSSDINLQWSGGEAMNPADSSKRRIKRNKASIVDININGQGATNVPVHRIAVVKLSVIMGKTKLDLNSDDDNNSANPNATPSFNGSDLDETTVNNEDDLVSMVISVEPSEVKGKIEIDLSEATKLRAYQHDNKNGVAPDNWDLNSEDFPLTVYIEGRGLSDTDNDQRIKVNYIWGIQIDESVNVTVDDREGKSSAQLGIYTIGINDSIGENVSGLIGGHRYVVLNLRIGPGEKLISSGNIKLRIKEDTTIHDVSTMQIEKIISLDDNTVWEQGFCVDNVVIWRPGPVDDAPSQVDNSEGSQTLYFRGRILWDTANEPSHGEDPYPKSHNANHVIEIIEVDGDEISSLEFQHVGVVDSYCFEIGLCIATLKNVLITNVISNAGNSDFLICDPRSDDNNFKNPSISFVINDIEENHTYRWSIFIRDTRLNDWSDYIELSGVKIGTGIVNEGTTWDGKKTDGTDADWGTYAIEILVIDDIDNDDIYHKTDFTEIDTHNSLLVENNNDNNDKIITQYTIIDKNQVQPSSIEIQVLSPTLETVTQLSNLPITLNTTHEFVSYTLGDDSMLGTYITIVKGQDNRYGEYREHANRRLMAVNSRPIVSAFVESSGTYSGANWYGVWIKRRYVQAQTEFKSNTKNLIDHVNDNLPVTTDTNRERVSVAINGTLATSNDNGTSLGFVGEGKKVWNHGKAYPFPSSSVYGNHIVSERYGFYYNYYKFGEGFDSNIYITKDVHRTNNANDPWYDDKMKSDNYELGFSGLGCLLNNKTPLYDTTPQCSTWPDKDIKRQRSIVGWSKASANPNWNLVNHMYFVICDIGWTWNESVEFVNNIAVGNACMNSAMMLDGGGSSSIILRHLIRNQKIETETDTKVVGCATRKLPNCIRATYKR